MSSKTRTIVSTVLLVVVVICVITHQYTLAFLAAMASAYVGLHGFPTNKDLRFAQKYRQLDGAGVDPAEVKKYRKEHPGVGVTEAAYEVKKAGNAA